MDKSKIVFSSKKVVTFSNSIGLTGESFGFFLIVLSGETETLREKEKVLVTKPMSKGRSCRLLTHLC